MSIKESDWKIYRKIREKAIDTFCQRALKDFQEVLHNEEGTAHDRYIRIYRAVQKRNKLMAQLFDQGGHSRSSAWIWLRHFRAHKLADEDLVNQLSEEMRLSTDVDQ